MLRGRAAVPGRPTENVYVPSRPALFRRLLCAATSHTQTSYACSGTARIRRATVTGSCLSRCVLSYSVLEGIWKAEKGACLVIRQEYMGGKALDEQLYEEGWQPTSLQALKAAIDVARGMEYLHSAFEDPQYGRRNPIIHRDLKSPNLLLTRPPPRSAMDLDTTLKISDFGVLSLPLCRFCPH